MEEIIYRLTHNCPHLTEIDLSKKNIDNASLKKLLPSLEVNTHLTSLNLENNFITEDGAIFLSKTLEKNKTIVNLKMGGNRLRTVGDRALAKIAMERKPPIQLSLITKFRVTGYYDGTLYHIIE